MWDYVKSKMTKIVGGLLLACGGVHLTGTLEAYDTYMVSLCAMLAGLGFFAAKPVNVTNAPEPLPTPVVVPPPVVP